MSDQQTTAGPPDPQDPQGDQGPSAGHPQQQAPQQHGAAGQQSEPEAVGVHEVPADDEAAQQAATEVPPADEGPSDADRAAGLQDELLREKASFHNYRELMKRERPKDREQAISSVVESLVPVLDDIHYAREHGDLTGSPFEKIADKLTATLTRYGVEPIGAAGETFDPARHEALMHVDAELPPGATDTTVVQVMQPGYKIGERVVRPARVSVADPS